MSETALAALMTNALKNLHVEDRRTHDKKAALLCAPQCRALLDTVNAEYVPLWKGDKLWCKRCATRLSLAACGVGFHRVSWSM